ncbi:MAG: hypothetical protein LUC50_02380 [Ruminococcus sp.]|nr:hypothetical protein [Ruminococcus sp.]
MRSGPNFPEKTNRYLSLCKDVNQLDNIETVKFLSASVGLTGQFYLYDSGNYRNALVVMLETGELLPNPYYFLQIFSRGEPGDVCKKLSPLFQM